jgi:hypothetical protein
MLRTLAKNGEVSSNGTNRESITDEWRRTHLYVYSDFRTSALSLNRQQGSALTNKAHGVHPEGYSLVDRLTALYPISRLMQLIARIRFGQEARLAEPRTASLVTQAKDWLSVFGKVSPIKRWKSPDQHASCVEFSTAASPQHYGVTVTIP